MKLLFDQNISPRILNFLSEDYKNSSSIKKEGLINALDLDIWNFAKTNGFIIVTQDSDFNDLNTLYGFPPKIIWIRVGNLRTRVIAKILNDYKVEIDSFARQNASGCFEIIKLRLK